jgi:XTP/dITP diphosphohydrolase
LNRLIGQRLVIATHNSGKLREIAELVAPYGIATVGARELGLPEPEETGTTFEANAELKARTAATESGLPALADDSGLVVPALNGAPGIYSARWAGATRDFAAAMAKVEAELAGKLDRRAYFVAVLALAWPDTVVATFRGEAHGDLVWPPRGENGFGYDPIFRPDGCTITFGEMPPPEKRKLNHRARAFAKFEAACLR